MHSVAHSTAHATNKADAAALGQASAQPAGPQTDTNPSTPLNCHSEETTAQLDQLQKDVNKGAHQEVCPQPTEAEPLPLFMQHVGYPFREDDQPQEYSDQTAPDDADQVLSSMYDADHNYADFTRQPHTGVEGWPFPSTAIPSNTATLYEKAIRAARDGSTPPQVDQTTTLKTETWEREATSHPADAMVIQGIKYGFPTQYAGPPIPGPTSKYNHHSANAFPDHVRDYIATETADCALSGPYTTPPFTPWFHASPIITREKSGDDGRRIIVDLSYLDGGINKHIAPHVFNGHDAIHNLPTVSSAVATIAAAPPGEVHRAYRHFPVTPLDWPLLGIHWEGHWAFDRRMPFGCSMSSYVMQSIAEYIVRANASRSIKAHMYLDDVIVVSNTAHIAQRDHDAALRLLYELRLKVAKKKVQPPDTAVVWLGIRIDIPRNELSIPEIKLGQIKRSMAMASRKSYISKKTLQSLIGLANHLMKVVRAARTFICRLLAALCAATSDTIKVSKGIKADLGWFARYLTECNGRAVIPVARVVKRIWADACMKGAGASDGRKYYEHTFSTGFSAAHHIVHLEAVNCLAAVRILVDDAIPGGTVEVMCDNRPTVDAFTSGRARDEVLAACARALWYHAAQMDVDLVFTHVPGEGMALPDALSRASLDAEGRAGADGLISKLRLIPVSAQRATFNYKPFL